MLISIEVKSKSNEAFTKTLELIKKYDREEITFFYCEPQPMS